MTLLSSLRPEVEVSRESIALGLRQARGAGEAALLAARLLLALFEGDA